MWRKAADLGYAGAMCNLGACYAYGEGVARSDAEAAKWWRKAADLGDAGAMYNLGTCYENGRGVQKSPDKAVEWYQKAARLGNDDAKRILNAHGIGH